MPYTALRRARLDRKLTQEQVAALIGVSQPTVVNYETARSYPLNPDVQRALRKLFGVPLPVLLASETTNAAPKGDAR